MLISPQRHKLNGESLEPVRIIIVSFPTRCTLDFHSSFSPAIAAFPLHALPLFQTRDVGHVSRGSEDVNIQENSSLSGFSRFARLRKSRNRSGEDWKFQTRGSLPP